MTELNEAAVREWLAEWEGIDSSSPFAVLCRSWLAQGEALAAAQQAVTDAHGKLWLLGLDNHEGEEPQPREECHRNLDKLLDQAGEQ